MKRGHAFVLFPSSVAGDDWIWENGKQEEIQMSGERVKYQMRLRHWYCDPLICLGHAVNG